jgi:hypothetical protein
LSRSATLYRVAQNFAAPRKLFILHKICCRFAISPLASMVGRLIFNPRDRFNQGESLIEKLLFNGIV